MGEKNFASSIKHARVKAIFILIMILVGVFSIYVITHEKICFDSGYTALRVKLSRANLSSGFDNKTEIHIVIVSDKTGLIRYPHHGETLQCYAYRHDYQLIFLDPGRYYTCANIVNFFFRKQCAVMIYLMQNPQVQWLLVLDGDTLVVNATQSLQSFLPKDPQIHLIHYERTWFNEIMAGNYIIRNHPWSLLYLNKWVERFTSIPNVRYHNHDNGMLHLHFIDIVGKLDNRTYEACSSLYNKSENEWRYLIYVGCTKCALGGQKRFQHVILHRRAHSFCRDNGLRGGKIHPLDFMLHTKDNPNIFFEEPVNKSTCVNDQYWTPKIRQSLLVNLSIAKILIAEWDRTAAQRYPQSVALPDISDCWPDCDPEINGKKLVNYTSLLCNYSRFS